MKSSAILREAARRVELCVDMYACCAIFGFAPNAEKTREAFTALYRDDSPYPLSVLWAGNAIFPDPKGWTRDDRVIALCLAAAIAESEGD